ncbi:MAG: hypothetical protein ACRDDW_07390 [Candidatus Rhabdochlamydia sp.]
MPFISPTHSSIENQPIFSIQPMNNGFKTAPQVHQTDTLSFCAKKKESSSLNPQLSPTISPNASYLFLLANLASIVEDVKKNVSCANKKHIDESVRTMKHLAFEHHQITNNTKEQEDNCKQWKRAQAITIIAVAAIPIALVYCPAVLPSLLNPSLLLGTIGMTVNSQKNMREANLSQLKAEEAQTKQTLDNEQFRQKSLVKSIGDQDVFTDTLKELSRVLQNMSQS